MGEQVNNDAAVKHQFRNGTKMMGEATTEKSLVVGNATKMREALENSNGLLEELALIGEWSESAREQIAENNAALSSPARNCDLPEVMKDPLGTWRRDFRNWDEFGKPKKSHAEWLLAEAKGEAK